MNIKKISVIFFLIIALLYMTFSFYDWLMEREKFGKECQNYLIEQYNNNMKIDSIEYSFKNFEFSACISLENSDIKFRAVKGRNGISDNFFVESWKYEISNDINNFITSVYGTKKGTSQIYFTQGSPINNSEYKVQNKVPNFLSIRDKFTTSIFVFIHIPLDFDAENDMDEYEKIYKVVEYVFKKYLPNNMMISFSNDIQFKIGMDEFNAICATRDACHLCNVQLGTCAISAIRDVPVFAHCS